MTTPPLNPKYVTQPSAARYDVPRPEAEQHPAVVKARKVAKAVKLALGITSLVMVMASCSLPFDRTYSLSYEGISASTTFHAVTPKPKVKVKATPKPKAKSKEAKQMLKHE